MEDLRLDRLRHLAVAMHAAISNAEFREDDPSGLRSFPAEACNFNMRLLGSYLFERGFIDIRELSGRRADDEEGEHHWIEVDGITVDITAYQFDPGLEEVIVLSDSSWHAAQNGKQVNVGAEGETLEQYFARVSRWYDDRYNGLFGRLKVLADRYRTERVRDPGKGEFSTGRRRPEIEDCPYGFADGAILGYTVIEGEVSLEFRFWNDKKAVFKFGHPVSVQDEGAVGATIGAADSLCSSDAISRMLDLLYVARPETSPWRHFRFLDVDDRPVLQIVAEECRIELECS